MSVLLTRCLECERPELLMRLISKSSENDNIYREFVKCESKPHTGKVCLYFADYYLFMLLLYYCSIMFILVV
jgi:hypothetical protein